MISPSSPSSPRSDPIGLIGLGLVGSELAQRLTAGGRSVIGYDINPERLAEFVQLGGAAAGNAADVFSSCKRVLVSLPSHREVSSICALHAASFCPGATIIDTTTGDPASSEAIAASLQAQGITYLDATISGSSKQVRDGSAVMMVGGDAAGFAACQDLFDLLADATFHTGPSGSGAKMKLVTNLVLGLNRAALAEGLAFAEGLSLDLALVLKIMRRSPAYSRAMDVKGDKMIQKDFSPEARLSQHLKDVRLIVEAGIASGLPMSLSLAHRAILEHAEAEGHGELDNSAVIRVLSARDSIRTVM
jgi:3-hydroxyisobutyrate dehydrogenase-like beta-hydroxyacid dehydrogenase